jgi:hypothetical protein
VLYEAVAAGFSKTPAGERLDEASAIHIGGFALINVTVRIEHTLRVEQLCSGTVKS